MSSLRARRKNIELIWGADEVDTIVDQEASKVAAFYGSQNLLRAIAHYFARTKPQRAQREYWKEIAQ